MNSAPPTTSASLLASSSRLPARAAARQGARPAAPTMAAITLSTSGCAASSHSASAPTATSVRKPRAARPARSRRAAVVGRHHGDARPEPQALRQQFVDAAEGASGR